MEAAQAARVLTSPTDSPVATSQVRTIEPNEARLVK